MILSVVESFAVKFVTHSFVQYRGFWFSLSVSSSSERIEELTITLQQFWKSEKKIVRISSLNSAPERIRFSKFEYFGC